MAEQNSKKQKITYKYGDNDLDLDLYIKNLSSNVLSYIQDRIKRGGWNQNLVQEFTDSYNRYEKAFRDQLANNSGRFYTTSTGGITDTKNEFSNSDTDGIDPSGSQWYYDVNGNRITSDDYALLKDKKKQNYKPFNANQEVATYFRKIGNYLQKATTTESTAQEKYDASKHGWDYWWGHVKNLDGGDNLASYLEMDPADSNHHRAVTNRASAASEWVKEYSEWLNGKNLDYSDNAISQEDLTNRLTNLSLKWGDGNWESDDLIAAAQAGIGHNWTDQFFTTEEDPNITPEQRAQIEKDKLAELDAAAAQLEQEAQDALAAKDAAAWDEHIKKKLELYEKNHGPYYQEGNKQFVLKLPDNADMESALSALSTSDSGRNAQFASFYNNPFNNDAATINVRRNILWLLINNGRASQLEDGSYYLRYDPDIAKGRALIYDPSTSSLKYRFIGDVPEVWDEIRNKYAYTLHPENKYQQYRKEGGTIKYFQYGGGFDYAGWTNQLKQNYYAQKGQEKGTSAAREQARDRQVSKGFTGVTSKDFMHQQNEGFTDIDKARLVGAGADIVSLISAMFPGYGTAVSGVSGVTSTAANAYADYNDKSLSFWDATKNLAINLGMDALGLIPEGGSASKAAKIAKNLAGTTSKLMAFVGTASAISNGPQILQSLTKLKNGETLSVGDWQNVAQAIGVATGLGAGATRHVTKLADAYNPKGYDRRSATKVDDKVAVEFLNKKTNKKETRVFQGDDASAIRSAQEAGDIAALRRATTEKYEDLRHLDINTHGQRPTIGKVEGKTFPRLTRTEGEPVIYDLMKDPKGNTFIRRGTNGMFDFTGDISDVSKVKSTNGTTIEAAENVVKADADVAEAIRYSQAREKFQTNNSLEKQKTKLRDKLTAKQQELTAYKNAHPTPTTEETAKINELAKKIADYTRQQGKLNSFDISKLRSKSKATERLEGRKDSEGNIIFKPATGDPIVRSWTEIINKYGIKYKQGGKVSLFASGTPQGGITSPMKNVSAPNGEISWFDSIYNTNYFKNYINSITPSNYGNFNKLQYTWFENLTNTKYNPENPSKAISDKTNKVQTRQVLFDATGINQAIWDLNKSGALVGNGGTKDTAAGHGVDNVFGRQEYLRHFGTLSSWAGHEDLLAELLKSLQSKGLDYYLDTNSKMYLIKPIKTNSPANDPTPEEDTVPEISQNSGSVTDPIEHPEELLANGKKGNNWGQQVLAKLSDPKWMSIARNAYANAMNNKMTDVMKAAEKPVIYNSYELHRYNLGDLDRMMSGNRAFGQIMHIADLVLTSDARLWQASMNDSANKGLEYQIAGAEDNNTVQKASKEEIWKENKETVARNNAVDGSNLQEMQQTAENIAADEAARISKEFTNNDVVAQEFLADAKLKYKTDLAKQEAYKDYFTKNDIDQLVTTNLGQYADVTQDELDAWNKVMVTGEVTYSELAKDPKALKAFQSASRKADEAKNKQLRIYYNVPESPWSNARNMASNNISEDEIASWFTPVHKSGGSLSEKTKIRIAQMRERQKDADRVSKRHKEVLDRNEKSLDRLQKRMYKHNDYPLTKKK